MSLIKEQFFIAIHFDAKPSSDHPKLDLLQLCYVDRGVNPSKTSHILPFLKNQ